MDQGVSAALFRHQLYRFKPEKDTPTTIRSIQTA